MSGHSKWSNIKHKKSDKDAVKAASFTRIAQKIKAAMLLGSNEPDHNAALRVAVAEARTSNMPAARINRLIGKASDSDKHLEDFVYEFRLTDNVNGLAVGSTDNTNRSLTDMKTVLGKAGYQLAPAGSVQWEYDLLGEATFEGEVDETLLAQLLDVPGFVDFLIADGETITFFAKEDFRAGLNAVVDKLGLIVKGAELIYRPKNVVDDLTEEKWAVFEELFVKIEDLPDVDNIFHNIQL